MNKYLEKIALSPAYNAIAKGGLYGAALGGLAGYNIPKKESSTTKKVLSAIGGGLLGAEVGGRIGIGIHIAKSGSSFPRYVPFKNHLKDIGLNKTPKTKAEIHKHFKSQAMKLHPDRPAGDAKKMTALNEAYTKIKHHPDFEKLASMKNKFLSVI